MPPSKKLHSASQHTAWLFASGPGLVLGMCLGLGSVHAVAEEEKEHSGSPHWEYAGELGPEQWAELEGCSACNGEHQSPVNIIRTDTQPDSQANWPLVLRYPAETTIHSVVNNGHSIQYDFDRGDQLDFADNTYDLMQFHFHEPSEHTLNGIRYPIEMHLVHYNQEIDEYVVLAVVGYEGTPSDAYAFLEQYLPLQPGESRDIDKPFNLRTALPDSLTPRFHYRGSLTTPPCTESVNWIVFEEPFMLSHEQVVELQRVMPFNNYRGTQPLNDRQVSLIVH